MTQALPSDADAMRAILDAIPSMVFVVDFDFRILAANRAAAETFGEQARVQLKRLCGEVIHCLRNLESEDGCGTTPFCPNCDLRKAVDAARQQAPLFRRRTSMRLQRDGTERLAHFVVTGAPIQYEGQPRALLILEDVTELIELRQLIPVCSHCRKVRTDDEYWGDLLSYLSKTTNLRFTHGICPECLQKEYPEDASAVIEAARARAKAARQRQTKSKS